MSRPQTIQIFLPQGDPQGIRRGVLTTRTVVVFDVPRTQLNAFVRMDEATQVGLYFLLGKDENDAPTCYVGETESVGTRLKQHNANRESWNRALVAVDLTNQWTKTHVRFMEIQAIARIANGGRFSPENGNTGISTTHTPAPLRAECEELLETIEVLTTTLGSPVLRPTLSAAETSVDDSLHLTDRNGRYDARGTLTTDGFTVFAGSRCRVMSDAPEGATLAPASHREALEARRQQLIHQGVLAFAGGALTFARDHEFDSPSGAASVVVGNPTNGWVAWCNRAGTRLNIITGRASATEQTHDGEATHV